MLSRRSLLKWGALGLFAASPTSANSRPTGLVLDPRFAHHTIQPGHPERPERYAHWAERLTQAPWLAQVSIAQPSMDASPWLSQIHSDAHIRAISTATPHFHEAAMLATSGMLTATDKVCSGQWHNALCASRPPGHHAENQGREEGFCFYNHVAIAARYAQVQYGLERILIVDWDYHHGNGTEWAFYADPSVLFFSTHDAFAYPGTGDPAKTGSGAGQGFNINVHLPCGSGDAAFFAAFDDILAPAAEKFQPDLVLISAGFDSREDDLLGCHRVTDAGFSALTQRVMAIADRFCGGKVVSVLEGGYNLAGNAASVLAHCEALSQRRIAN